MLMLYELNNFKFLPALYSVRVFFTKFPFYYLMSKVYHLISIIQN